jgi:hypothetical protein
MDVEEFRKRLEAARTLAAMQRLEAVEMLAMNVELRIENAEAFARQTARQPGQDREIGVQPTPIQATDPKRR